MRNTRIEIEEAENGYTMKVWKNEEKEEDDKEDFGYYEPKVLVATTLDEVSAEINKCFKKGK